MESLYILEQGTFLRREGNSLKVMQGNKMVERIPAGGLKRLMLVGYVSLTGSVLDYLIANRVETVFVTPTGRFRARLGLNEHRHVALRSAQYGHLNDKKYALDTARKIVQGKIRNMYRFLRVRAVQYKHKEMKITALKLRSMAVHADTVQDMEVLRGLEGAASRIYFSAFPGLIRNGDFSFRGRNKRPPRDPVNALLSFIYTLLTNEVQSAINICGLDPYLGSLHEISYGRPSLACDLVEEYRVFLGDRLILGLINKKLIRPHDFIIRENAPASFTDEEEMKKSRPVEMKPAVARALIKSYEKMMARRVQYPRLEKQFSYRRLILNQVRLFGQVLEKGEGFYQPFEWEV
jgi:CRISPR-associated protein Cas1